MCNNRVLKKPCNQCPFRKESIPNYLGGVYKDGQELHDFVVSSENPFPCHLTIKEDEISLDNVGTQELPYCAGALIYMSNIAKLPRNREHTILVNEIDRSLKDTIFSYGELQKHHTSSIGYIKPYQDNNDLSNGKRTSDEVKEFIGYLLNQREELPETTFFGDNNWLRIDTQIDILKGDLDEEDLDCIDLDEMAYADCMNVYEWLNGYLELDEFFDI